MLLLMGMMGRLAEGRPPLCDTVLIVILLACMEQQLLLLLLALLVSRPGPPGRTTVLINTSLGSACRLLKFSIHALFEKNNDASVFFLPLSDCESFPGNLFVSNCTRMINQI